MVILETKDLSFSYPDGTVALDNINIRIEEGKKIAFVGRNGSGKSTLFLSMNGTHRPGKGEILFHGKPLKYDSRSLREVRKNVGIVFQNSDDQIFAPTIYQDVAFGPTNLDYPKEKVKQIVHKTLEYVGLMHLKDKPPHHLSGGQKKRVAIAGIVAMDPEIIILDEPLANLDPVGADEVMDLLNEQSYFGKTIIISTHDVNLAYSWADYVFLMSEHKIISEGTPEEIFVQPDKLKAAHLRRPATLEIYEEIKMRGLAKTNCCPRDIPDLVHSLRSQHLLWVDVPPEVKEGDYINLGIFYGEYAQNSAYEAANCKVLHIHDDGLAIAEMDRKAFRAGSIGIYDTAKYSREDLLSIIERDGVECVGAMGKKSKLIAEKDDIYLDVTAGVIDRSILNALAGQRCLILTHDGMVHHAMDRIRAYMEKSGINIPVSVINPNPEEQSKQDVTKSMMT
ncbi:energy-coupling factor ABC transporter ATP-binding protein [Methanolobus halotolerans]|uniref:ABC transporter ATP-binding protein n=1 Tax=Methanolobus halotolerans TaxID=2052935 RepID=A0A4E0R1H4_9EURY|nr:ATP-binding cassette domain-containing protein [Methanolobus halotolerans]TGC11029.1 ABC transporter ATP-binding protein [Methanolobus halotolerans]